MHQCDESGYVTEAEAGHQSRLQREPATQSQGLPRPDEVTRDGQFVIEAVQAAVGRDDAVTQHLAQAEHLEHRGTALGMAGEGLLRHHEQRCSGRAPECVGEALVKFGLVGIVGQSGRVVFGDDRDIVGAHSQSTQRARQHGITSTTAGTEGTESGRRDRGVHTIGETLRVADHGQHRQTHLQRQIAARQQDGAAALGLQEPQPAAIVGAGDLRITDTAGPHHLGVGGGRHVTEAGDGVRRHIVEPAGDHQFGLAESDLVDALFHRHRRGGTGANRMDHRAVTADIGLHHMCGNDIRQHLLQDVIRFGGARDVAVEHRPHAGQAADAGALGVGNQAGVHPAHEFGRGEPGG